MPAPTQLTADTTAALLLCGHFGIRRRTARPLTPAEFHILKHWLEERRRPLAYLLSSDLQDLGRGLSGKDITPSRIAALLARRDELAATAERWSQDGIWVMSEIDPDYPARLSERLGSSAAPLLFGAGDRRRLSTGGICIVGSRDSAPSGLKFARSLGNKCGQQRVTVISSDMRGINREAIMAAVRTGGSAIAVVSDSLEKAVTVKRIRSALAEGVITLFTPFAPDTRFTVANAMRANKYQYAISDLAVVVETRRHGGVWSGADENRNEGWVPAFVRIHKDMAPGNTALLHLGLAPLTQEDVETANDLRDLFFGSARPGRGLHGTGVPSQGPTDFYILFLDDLKTWLATDARNEREIAAHFGLERSQVKAWLQRAVDGGELQQLRRPLRYAISQH